MCAAAQRRPSAFSHISTLASIFSARSFGNSAGNPLDFAHTRRTNFDLQVDLPELGEHALSVGAQYSDENTDAWSFGIGFDRNTYVTQGFVQDQFALGRVTSRLAVGFVDHSTFGSEVTWNAEFGTSFGTGTRVALSGGKAFRAPDATDRFGFGGRRCGCDRFYLDDLVLCDRLGFQRLVGGLDHGLGRRDRSLDRRRGRLALLLLLLAALGHAQCPISALIRAIRSCSRGGLTM